MRKHNNFCFVCLTILFFSSCVGQEKSKRTFDFGISELDQMQALYYGIPDQISPIDTSPGWNLKGQKILLTGQVLHSDGISPANNVILYYYQTNMEGRYETNSKCARNMPKNGLVQTHGYIRGWVKTDHEGRYFIYTVMPGSYPNRKEPAHIHLTVKDNKLKDPYYLDSYVFDNDPLLTKEERQTMENRGGSGVIRFVEKEGIWIGERDIYLGLNVPGYPGKNINTKSSGRAVGEDLFSFTPFHAFGPDKGTKTCPICKYGWYMGVFYFVGNYPNWDHIKKWLTFLDALSKERREVVKVFFVYGNEQEKNEVGTRERLELLGHELGLELIALTYVPSFSDVKSHISENKINADVENTILVYKRSKIVSKFIDMKPTFSSFVTIQNILDSQVNEYFYLKAVGHSK